jgi:O-antigen ligase
MLAISAAILAAMVLNVASPSSRRTIGPALALVPVAVSVVVPMLATTPTAFANRGFIWVASLDQWGTNPWFGLGSDWYKRIGQTSERLAGSVFSGHNQFVQFLVTGGLLMIVSITPLIVAAAVRAGRMAAVGQTAGVVFLVALGTAGILEKTFSLTDYSAVFGAVFIPLAFILLAEYRPVPQAQQLASERLGERERIAGATSPRVDARRRALL